MLKGSWMIVVGTNKHKCLALINCFWKIFHLFINEFCLTYLGFGSLCKRQITGTVTFFNTIHKSVYLLISTVILNWRGRKQDIDSRSCIVQLGPSPNPKPKSWFWTKANTKLTLEPPTTTTQTFLPEEIVLGSWKFLCKLIKAK